MAEMDLLCQANALMFERDSIEEDILELVTAPPDTEVTFGRNGRDDILDRAKQLRKEYISISNDILNIFAKVIADLWREETLKKNHTIGYSAFGLSSSLFYGVPAPYHVPLDHGASALLGPGLQALTPPFYPSIYDLDNGTTHQPK